MRPFRRAAARGSLRSVRFLPVLQAVAALLMCALRAQAEQPVPRDETASMQQLAEGVFVIIHDDATDEWPHGNTGVVVGDDAVLVLDSAYLPSRAEADIALIRHVTDRPVRYLAITHWHFDHNNGTVAYKEAYPAVTVVSERETARFVDLNGTWWSRMNAASGSDKRKSLADKEAELAAAKDPAAKRALETVVRQRRAELEELEMLRVVTPDLLFEEELSLDLGGRRVELRDWGRANSPHDVTAYLPDERILFTGDIVVQSPLPYSGASWPVPWIEVLRGLEAMPVAAVVPGHGPVQPDHAYTHQVRELLERVTSRVESLAREGRTLEQIQAAFEANDLRKGVWADPALDEDWKVTMTTLIERAWRGVRGQGG
jgi:glyoxylase-like metal-dependent hydrolase (beta-lactamase superfamily II)